MATIGIVGAGVAGLHLGLHLRQQGRDVTIYTNRTAQQVADGKVMNSVAHMSATIDIERELGIADWPETDAEYSLHHHYNGWGEERRFSGSFEKPARVIDYRIYLPRLMDEFESRGGTIEYRDLSVADIENLTEVHDLVVVSTGKGEIGALFPRREDKSPFTAPQRKLAVGFWKGVASREPRGVEISLAPPAGELLTIPMWSFSGLVHALLFESVPGGAQEVLTDSRYEDDPARYREATLSILEEFHPSVFERVDARAFELQNGAKDILQGAVTPVLREDYTLLPNGRFLLALGDVHMTVDPIQAQGANSAAYSAKVIADAVAEDQVFDERFMKKVARRRAERLEASNDWVNTIIQTPPAPHIPELFSAMVHDQALADRFTENFNYPIRQVDLLGTSERVAASRAATAALV
ncbi:monooxygenase [Microbacterium sp. HMWF026]|uniref:styrene monooxygenase/indole monooxygenase family protein n=1 Tax=Microbacterium sp. HMWF026 TaxID=2056861 RepID=UPI000D3ACCCD|nr:styrene monooxygenase/indole monooxygenase family protein [Microbacterium sp. HMWF026]PTT19724.1 monooxygenase [Microbacterium sp. HMWF026]